MDSLLEVIPIGIGLKNTLVLLKQYYGLLFPFLKELHLDIILLLTSQVKAYTTRVGSGPFPTELLGKTGDTLRMAGMEFGTTTGRPRRCGWLDLVALKYCCQINGFSSLNLTKLDVFSGFPEIKLGVSYHKPGGERVESFPADLELLEQIQVCQVPALSLLDFIRDSFYRIAYVGLSLM